jgi:hypothetical protein
MINTTYESTIEEILLEASSYNLREEVKNLGERLYQATQSKKFKKRFGHKLNSIFTISKVECYLRAYNIIIKD